MDELQELRDLLDEIPEPGDPVSFTAAEPDYGRTLKLIGKRLFALEEKQKEEEIRNKALAPIIKWGLGAVGTISLAALAAGLGL